MAAGRDLCKFFLPYIQEVGQGGVILHTGRSERCCYAAFHFPLSLRYGNLENVSNHTQKHIKHHHKVKKQIKLWKRKQQNLYATVSTWSWILHFLLFGRLERHLLAPEGMPDVSVPSRWTAANFLLSAAGEAAVRSAARLKAAAKQEKRFGNLIMVMLGIFFTHNRYKWINK